MRWTQVGGMQADGRSGLGFGNRAGGLGMGCFVALLASLAAVMVLGAASASAEPLCTDTWTGPAEGTWQTEADWSTGKTPTSSEVACIGAGKTVEVNGGTNQTGVVQGAGALVIAGGSFSAENSLETSEIKDLTMAGGHLTGPATVEVSGSLSWIKESRMQGSGSTVILPGATASTTSMTDEYERIEKRRIVNDGTYDESEGEILMNEGAEIINAGTFEANEEAIEAIGIYGAGGTFVNNGVFQKTSGTGTAEVGLPFENNDIMAVTKGKVTFSDGGSSGAASKWEAGGGSEIRFSDGTFSMEGGTLSGSLTVIGSSTTINAKEVKGSTAQVTLESNGLFAVQTGFTTVEDLTMAGGKLGGSATLSVSHLLSWTKESRMQGSGSTVILPGATASTTSMIYSSARIEKRRIVNEGTYIESEGTILMNEGAEIVNSGTFEANDETKIAIGMYGAGGTFTNTGIFEKAGGIETIEIEPDFENLGQVKELSGHIKFLRPIFVEQATQYGGAKNASNFDKLYSECGDPVSCATGNFTESQTDFAIGGRGVGLDLARYYNSQAAAEGIKGPFGYGWTSSFSDHLVVNKTSKITTLYEAEGSTVPFTEEGGGAFKAPVWTQDTLTGTEGTGYTLTLADQIKYKFAGSSGRLESVTDRDGNATTLTYNESGQLTTITDPVSRTIKLTYNGEGLVESAEDPMKHVVKYTYEAGNLKSVTQPAESGLRWQFKYDGSHRMTEMVDGRSGKTTNEYNGANQVIKQEDPAGHKLKFEYEPFHTEITNETTGDVTNEYFTSNDEPSSITHGYGTASATTESFTYNAGGYVTSVTNGNGHTTKYGYDSANDRTSMVDPDSDETKWTYDSTHDVETETTPKGETTTIKRESHGNPEVVERPGPESKTQITKYKYTAHGELESVTNPLENVWKYEYDSKGDRTAEIDPEGNKRTWEYNEDSQVTAEVSPRGNIAGGKPESFKTKFERNALGLPLKITDPLSHVTEYKYDGDYNVEVVTDGNKDKTKYTYNGDNEPTKVEEANKTITETEYDGDGQVVIQTNGNKHKTKYVRNAVEEVTEEVNTLGKKTVKEYDGTGNLVKVTDPESHTTTYTYDPANRLTEVSYSTGKPSTIKYEYDKDGDRTKMTDGTGTTKYVYDQLDRLTESENGNKEVAKYEYNIGNEQTGITYPNKKTVTRTFDKDGRLEKLTDWLRAPNRMSFGVVGGR